MTDETTDELAGVTDLAWCNRRERSLRIDMDESISRTARTARADRYGFLLPSPEQGTNRNRTTGVPGPNGSARRLLRRAGRSHVSVASISSEVISK
ncbi:hypothetical protein [Halocatena pleomorpha]|uniref:Uncharacterized protein n=1 Tax=Halocatena pleomorpha TaxID=1785090 RepID=A0A3P3R698_9EURY|nr:hypothetical protein [Halocatena pleomorpha]RRJ28967.1 hypothetical protein EIK79_14745 [Halocatena pleomorpha]